MQLADSDIKNYKHIRSGGAGFIELPRGLIAVWGKEAVQFLDGMVTNDMKTLADGAQMLAAFPNAQGRLLAIVRVLRQGDRFLIETEEATREVVFTNLFRFTYAGDFYVEDVSQEYRYVELVGHRLLPDHSPTFHSQGWISYFIPKKTVEKFIEGLPQPQTNFIELSTELYELLRIESGIPKYAGTPDALRRLRSRPG
jgi:folate-binding Fe-S cluster repair protein YgfZ